MLASIVLGLIGGVTTVLGSLACVLYTVTKHVIIYGRNAAKDAAIWRCIKVVSNKAS